MKFRRKQRKLIRVFVIVSTVVLAFILFSSHLDARVGGGQGHSGRGRDGGGGGEILWFFVHLAIRYPKIGVPLLIIVIAYYIYSHKLLLN